MEMSLVHAQLHARQHHAAVAGTGSPADGFALEHGNFDAPFGESAGSGESGEACPDDGDFHALGEWTGSSVLGVAVVVSQ